MFQEGFQIYFKKTALATWFKMILLISELSVLTPY